MSPRQVIRIPKEIYWSAKTETGSTRDVVERTGSVKAFNCPQVRT